MVKLCTVDHVKHIQGVRKLRLCFTNAVVSLHAKMLSSLKCKIVVILSTTMNLACMH